MLFVWQLYFVDGEMLVRNPVAVMELLIKFLGLQSVDYNKLLKCVCAMQEINYSFSSLFSHFL